MLEGTNSLKRGSVRFWREDIGLFEELVWVNQLGHFSSTTLCISYGQHSEKVTATKYG